MPHAQAITEMLTHRDPPAAARYKAHTQDLLRGKAVTNSRDKQLVVECFDNARYPGGRAASLEHAWLGIYQVLWWYHHVDSQNVHVLHVREANDLSKAIWQKRAAVLESYIADAIDVEPRELKFHFDRMMKLDRWKGKQRNNPLGNGLRVLLSELCRRFANPEFDWVEEQDASALFPGIAMPGRSQRPKMDVVALRKDDGRPRAIISCKWAFKHDRISDPTNECQEYKAAAVRRQIMDMEYFVVTNEMSVSRLDKIINQPCVNQLVHVHLPGVAKLEPPSDLMANAIATGRMVDMVDFVRDSAKWL